ncbi:thioredoxin [Erysipelothrix rhusiopathiae]|uniref:thioredoxin n=1 Tax=Erysipelothrix rhusiopathiae TaxID=1648 RepID=UPI002B2479D6|nr:thioredoxin [Erysipelothrix rhusiopathiae]WRB93049.1 thioredoxin [Erysipelothrix rhusiopathiae]
MKKTLLVLLVSIFVLTGCTSNNLMKDYKGFTKKDHHYVTTDSETIIKNLEDSKEGIYYIGYADCPWCVALVPEMETVITDLEASYKEQGIEIKPEIMMLDVQNSEYSNNDDLKKRLSDWDKQLPEALRSNGYVPFVVAIDKDGKVQTHLGTVEGHKPPVALTETQVKFLHLRLKNMFDGIVAHRN